MEVPQDVQTGSITGSILDTDAFQIANRILDGIPEPPVFEDFGRYRIEKQIGKGGMAEVFLAWEAQAERWVAIKFMRSAWSGADLPQRFAREIRTLGRFEHPFIARLYEVGVHPNGTPWFAMEYVEGKPLDQYCRDRGYSVEERLRLFRSVCDAVEYAHRDLVVHRDLKPSNILVKEDGTPKLLDFGIAKQLEDLDEGSNQQQTELRFTRAFAAPEQLRGERVGVYTDVYALGVILYELLTGRPPYDLSECSPLEAEKVITGAPEPVRPSAVADRKNSNGPGKEAWKDLDLLCLTAMKKEVRERYASAVELRQDIDHFLNHEPLKARPGTWQYRAGKFIRRNRKAVAASALVFTLIIGLTSFFMVRLARARDRADRETAIAAAMNRFLSDDLLGRSDPFRSREAKETFADVVNQAASHIDPQFKDEPATAARLHQTIAKAFDSRSEFPPARREYGRASELFRRSDGPLSQDAILVNLQRAGMEARSYEQGSIALAKLLTDDAEKSMSRIARPNQDLAVWLPWARGTIAINENDAKTANRDFLAALHLAETIPSFDEAARRRIKVLVGASYIRMGDGARAEPLFREIADAYARAGGADNPDALRARVYLSQSLMVQRKYRAAIENANLIYPALVRRLGEDHEVTVAVLGTRAASEGSLGMWDEAVRDDLTAYHLAVIKHGPKGVFTIGMLSDAALSQCLAGRYVEGEANARKAFEESKKAFGARAGLTGGCAYALAICGIGENKLDEASELLRNIDVRATAELSGDPTVGASISLAQGRIAARKGDYALARQYADAAAPAFELPGAAAGETKDLQELRAVIRLHPAASK